MRKEPSQLKPEYEPPAVEDLDTSEGPSVTGAGVTSPQPTSPPG
jgi:hypothetical protein